MNQCAVDHRRTDGQPREIHSAGKGVLVEHDEVGMRPDVDPSETVAGDVSRRRRERAPGINQPDGLAGSNVASLAVAGGRGWATPGKGQ
jgi:hypothetical protein